MKENTNRVLAWIGLSEGGYVNHPKDPGGATDRGITQRTYDAWNQMHGRLKRPVRGISKAEAEEIIIAQYMAPVWFDRLPSGLDYSVADFSVNSGPARAVKTLQKMVGTAQDGVMGAITFNAIARYPDGLENLIVRYNNDWMRFLRGLSTFSTFGSGWKKRVMGKREGVQTDDIGVIDRSVMMLHGAAAIPAPTVPAPGKAPEEGSGQSAPPPALPSGSTIVPWIIAAAAAAFAAFQFFGG